MYDFEHPQPKKEQFVGARGSALRNGITDIRVDRNRGQLMTGSAGSGSVRCVDFWDISTRQHHSSIAFDSPIDSLHYENDILIVGARSGPKMYDTRNTQQPVFPDSVPLVAKLNDIEKLGDNIYLRCSRTSRRVDVQCLESSALCSDECELWGVVPNQGPEILHSPQLAQLKLISKRLPLMVRIISSPPTPVAQFQDYLGEVQAFLARLRLDSYIEALLDVGVGRLSDLQHVDDAVLDRVFGKKMIHRLKFSVEVGKLNF